jgi:hypothetical protein
MEAASHAHHHHHEMPTSGSALTSVAISATLHCLTGCAIGEVLGMVIGTALGFSDWGTIGLAVGLAFLFGYALTRLPLLRSGLALSAVIPIALASDTLSIATMEVVDNAIMRTIPGAMGAGLDDALFWGALSFALVIAGTVAVPLNRWLIARGKGHAVVHETGIHGGPSPRLVGTIAAIAFVFGTAVLVAETLSSDGEGMGHGDMAAEKSNPTHGTAEHGADSKAAPVRGLSASADGLTLALATTHLTPGEPGHLRFQVIGEGGRPVRDFDVEHTKRMHLIVARDDLTGFQHLHPRMSANGSWTTPVTFTEPGKYRVFADFKRDGTNQTLARTVTVDGQVERLPLAAPAMTASTSDGYRVQLDADASSAGRPADLAFEISRAGEAVAVDDYLGAKGHLVALREGDLAYLHTHPAEGTGHADPVRFETEFPTAGSYQLFLQFKHEGEVHTAAFTREVTE